MRDADACVAGSGRISAAPPHSSRAPFWAPVSEDYSFWALEIGLFRGKSGQRRVNWDRRNDAVERVLLPETINHRKWFGRLVHKKFYTVLVTSNLQTHTWSIKYS